MKLSIVIALYNTEKFIEKCIRSIYRGNKLDLELFEVIVINDGSTDQSPYIVEKLQKEFPNIYLVNKDNGGQSTARNVGFDLAKGQYLFCLDSDDYINAEKIEEMLEICISLKLDALSFSFKRISEDNKLISKSKINYVESPIVFTGGEFLNKFTISGTMWQYFYRTQIIRENNLRLIEGIYHEDEEFVIQFLSYSSRVKYIDNYFYNYLIRKESTVNNKDPLHRLKLLNDIVIVIKSLNIRLANLSEHTLIHSGISKKKEQLLVSLFIRMKRDGIAKNEVNKIILLLKDDNLYPITVKKSNYKFKLSSFLFNNSVFIKMFFL